MKRFIYLLLVCANSPSLFSGDATLFTKSNEDIDRLNEVVLMLPTGALPKQGHYVSVGGARSFKNALVFHTHGLKISKLIVFDYLKQIVDQATILFEENPAYAELCDHFTAIELDLNRASTWQKLVTQCNDGCTQKIAILDLSNVRQIENCADGHQYPGDYVDTFIETLKREKLFDENALILETKLHIGKEDDKKLCYATTYTFNQILHHKVYRYDGLDGWKPFIFPLPPVLDGDLEMDESYFF